MAYLVKKNVTLALKKEATEGVFNAPISTDYVKVESDSLDFKKEYETLTQEFIGSGLGRSKSKLGAENATGSITYPLTTGSVEGAVAPISLPLEIGLGEEKVVTEKTLDAGSTTTNLVFTANHGLVKNDIVLVKSAGAYEVRVISEVTALDEATITPALTSAPSAGVKIAACRQYKPKDQGHGSISIEHTNGKDSNAQKTKIRGAKVSEISITLETNQLGTMAVNLQALGMTRENSAPAATPSYSQAERTSVKDVYIVQNGNVIKVNNFGLSIADALVVAKNLKDGNESIVVQGREVKGTFNPYKQMGASGLAQWAKFDLNSDFSILVVQKNPNGTTGEGKNYVAIYCPNCQITTFEDGDVDGLLTDGLEFQASVTDGEDEVFIMIS